MQTRSSDTQKKSKTTPKSKSKISTPPATKTPKTKRTRQTIPKQDPEPLKTPKQEPNTYNHVKSELKPTIDTSDKTPKFLEKGHLYFLYRPKVQISKVESFDDVARMYLLLKPLEKNDPHYIPSAELSDSKMSIDEKPINRLIIISKKKLPNISLHEKFFGYVWKTSNDVSELTKVLEEEEYETITRGHRFIESARPCGEGVYGIITHENHTHLVYNLELPINIGVVQQCMNIEKSGSFVISVKNPEKVSVQWPGLNMEQRAKFDFELQNIFKDRRFIPANPVSFLDYTGCELLLIGANHDLDDLPGINQDLEDWEKEEDYQVIKLQDEKVFQELQLDRSKFKCGSLFGIWQ